jgi:hypothetical protein
MSAGAFGRQLLKTRSAMRNVNDAAVRVFD